MHEKSIEVLNKAVGDELHAVHQYMYFHFHCNDQGYDLLSNLFRATAIQEMMHVEQLAERVLFLKGEVNMVSSAPVERIHSVKDMLDKAKHMEESSVRDYNLWANECSANADSVSKKIFESLVAQEEGHYDQFDVQAEHINRFGEQYLALQSIERSRTFTPNPPTGPAGE